MPQTIYRRIHVCGTSGSGKTTLAARLAAQIGGDHIEIDSLWHRPNWTVAPVDEFRDAIARRVSGESWAIDGNYSKVRDLIWARADLVIYLDYPLPVVMARLTRRTFARRFRNELLWGTNRESLLRHFFVPKDSLYWWVLTTYKKRRAEYAEFSRDPAYSHIEFIRFRSPAATERWLRSLPATCRTAEPAS